MKIIKKVLLILHLIIGVTTIVYAQETVEIRLIAPNANDSACIVGSQESLGNWDSNKVLLTKTSDYEREISTKLQLPAEFKFTRGDWNTEGEINTIHDNPSVIISNQDQVIHAFHIRGWEDKITKEQISIPYMIERIKSINFPEQERLVKIYLPKNFDPSENYPVIYVLDGAMLFDIAINYVDVLTSGSKESYEVIPNSIVVGVFHSDRNYETEPNFKSPELSEGTKKLSLFLETELIPHIDSEYKTSGYNVLIGHSNTAYFALNLLMQENNPFRGIVSLSLTSGDYEDLLLERIIANRDVDLYIGYGTMDHDFKSELGKSQFSIEAYENMYIESIKLKYGIDVELTDMDYWHFIVECTKSHNKVAFENIASYYEQKFDEELGLHTYFMFYGDINEYGEQKRYAQMIVQSLDENDKKILYANIVAYIVNPDNIYSKPLKCSYTP